MMIESDFACIAEHGTELVEKYRGRWVAIHDGQVVGDGDAAPADRARQQVPDGDFILEAIDQESDVIYGAV